LGSHCPSLGGKFDRKKEEAIAALLTQRNIDEAAKAVGIASNTLLKWMKLPEFQKAYREARRAAFSQSIARLQQGTSAAATTLIKLLLDPNTPASVRARVADSIFNHAAKAIEIEDIEARVSALEASVGVDQKGRGR
jgi:transposase-like protein